MSLYKILSMLGLPLPVNVILSEILLLCYIMMVGFSPSAFRAAIMFSLFLIAKILKRSYDMISAMAAAAVTILTINPGYLYDASFGLSFLAILSVGYFVPKFINNTRYLKGFLKKKDSRIIKNRLYNRFCIGCAGSLIVSGWVYLIALPVSLCCYYETAIYSIILNIVIIPLMPVLLAGTIVSLIMTNAVNILGVVFVLIIKSILNFYKQTCLILAGLGLGRLNLGRPVLVAVAVYYTMLILACCYRGKRNLLVRSLCLVAAILCMTVKIRMAPALYMLDVDQGDSIVFINTDNRAIIFDGGSSSKKDVGKRRIIPFLKYHGIKCIETIFVSHPDADHLNGIIELVDESFRECLKINRICVYDDDISGKEYGELVSKANKAKVLVSGMSKGDAIYDKNGVMIECLSPYSGQNFDELNNRSLVLLLRYKDFSFLETGDIEEPAENEIVKDYSFVDLDILKVAHHGSSSSSSENFIKRTAPAVALISAGRNNQYGHPHKETLETLNAANARILSTNEWGQITVKISRDGKKYALYKYADG